MEEAISLEYTKSSLQCKRCREKDSHTFKFMLTDDSFIPYKVEVIRLQNEYIEDEKLYRVRAAIKWSCPFCGVPLQGVVNVRDIPIEILKEICGKCPSCGGNMDLENEKISLNSEGKTVDIIELSGEMVCGECRSKLPFSKKVSIKFRPIWNFIKEIKKFKVAKDEIQFER